MTKNCLSCVFCTRKMDFWSGPTPLLAKWKHEQSSLNALQRKALENGDDTFIERELRAAKLWEDQLAQARAKEREKYKGTGFDPAMLDVPWENKNKAVERFGLPERPKAPERDYLACYHQQWDERKEPEIRSKRLKFLKQTSCSFFYRFDRTHGEALAASEANRKDAQERSRFRLTTILILIGIAVTIVLGVLTMPKT